MTRSAAIAQAIADELAAKRVLLDDKDGPNLLNLVIRMGADGMPHTVQFRVEWDSRPRRLRKAC